MQSLSLVNKSFKDTLACILKCSDRKYKIVLQRIVQSYAKLAKLHFRKCRFHNDTMERNSAKPHSFISRDVTKASLPFGQRAPVVKISICVVGQTLSNKMSYQFLLFFTKYWEAASTASVHPKLIRAPSHHIWSAKHFVYLSLETKTFKVVYLTTPFVLKAQLGACPAKAQEKYLTILPK